MDKPIVIDGTKVRMGDIRRLSERFDLADMYALLRRCSNLTTDAELDELTLPEMRDVLSELNQAIGGTLVPKVS